MLTTGKSEDRGCFYACCQSTGGRINRMDSVPAELMVIRRGPFSEVGHDPELRTALGLIREEKKQRAIGEMLTASNRDALISHRQKEAQALEHITPQDAYPFTVRVAWRLCLAVGTARGYVSEGMTLERALGYPGDRSPKCPWEERALAIPTLQGIKALRDAPTPILPRYSSREAWTEQLETVTKAQGIRAGSRFLPFEGFWGLKYLWQDPHKYFPRPEDIFKWDALLLEDTKRILKESSKRALEEHLHEYYGLVAEEITYLFKAAAASLVTESEISKEAKEAILVSRTETMLMDEGLDPRTRLRVLESLAKIQGIGSLKREDTLLGDLVDEASQL